MHIAELHTIYLGLLFIQYMPNYSVISEILQKVFHLYKEACCILLDTWTKKSAREQDHQCNH
jgi:hypothetical protein